jgi:hypothetical protein
MHDVRRRAAMRPTSDIQRRRAQSTAKQAARNAKPLVAVCGSISGADTDAPEVTLTKLES